MEFTFLAENAVIKFLSQKIADGRKRQGLLVPHSHDAFARQISLKCREAVPAFGKKFQGTLYGIEKRRVRVNFPRPGIIQISKWGFPRENTPFNLFPNTSVDIAGKVTAVLVGHAEFKRHQNDIVGGKIRPVEGSNLTKNPALKKAHDFSCIIGISRKAVESPANNCICLSALNLSDHIVKNRSAGKSCASTLIERQDNFQT